MRERQDGAIEELLATFGVQIQGVAYLILRSHEDAEEVLMDTLVVAWRRANELRDDAALKSWLLRIATRTALSRRRKRRSVDRLEGEGFAGIRDGEEDSLGRIAIFDAMASLPQQQRAAIALHHYAGLTVAQTAAAMGKSENTIKTHLRVGMGRLRTVMREQEYRGERRLADA